MPSCCPRGSSGGGCRLHLAPSGTSGGRARGGRLTTIWLTAAPIPLHGREVFRSAPPWSDGLHPRDGDPTGEPRHRWR